MPLGALIGSGIQAGIAAGAASRSRRWARKNYKHRFQWSMEDMRKAGLNPILAAGGGLGGSGAMGNVPPAATPDVGRNITAARQVGNQKRLWNAQIEATTAQAAKTRQETENLGRQQPLNKLIEMLFDKLGSGAIDTAGDAITSAKKYVGGKQGISNALQTMLGATEQQIKQLLDSYNKAQKNVPKNMRPTWPKRNKR